jgi:hypothetical protein
MTKNEQIAVCIDAKFGLTHGKAYKIIPYPKHLDSHLQGYVRIENDFGQVFDYAVQRFEVVLDEPQNDEN